MCSSGRIDPPARFPVIPAILGLLVLLASSGGLRAQGLPDIQTDRPDVTECPFTVPAGRFQMENGFSLERMSAGHTAVTFPSSLLKWGLNDNMELRLTVELARVCTPYDTLSGLLPVTVGWKIHIMDEHGVWPQTALIQHLSIPSFSSDAFRTSYYAPSFRFAMQHTLSDVSTLGYNLGAEWEGETGEPTFLYSIASGWSLFERVGMYLEVFGFAPQENPADHSLAGGFSYLLAKNVLLDISGGVALTRNAPDAYVAAGFSFRLME